MRYLLLLSGLLIVLGCSRQTNNNLKTRENIEVVKDNHSDEVIKNMFGTWIHFEDSLAIIEVTGNEFTFKYSGIDTETTDRFKITISDTLTSYADNKIKTDFVILTNTTDTLHYELMSLTDDTMILIYYPRGKTHIYKRLK